MNVLSLFDGMSCGQIALNRIGIKPDNYFASEVDNYAIRVTQANFPNTVQLGDIRNVKASDLPKIDLVIGGSPCQGFSSAGKKLNFDDDRSALFFEYIRLLKECKPKYFLLENVIMNQASNDVISTVLGEMYPEYVTQDRLFESGRLEPIEINSALVSAQNRRRLYWTNIQGIDQPVNKGIYGLDIVQREVSTKNKPGWYLWWSKNGENQIRKRYSTVINDSLTSKGVTCTARQVASWNGNLVRADNNYLRFITPIECERLQTVPDNYTNHVSNTQRYKMLGNGWTVDVICHILKNIKGDSK